MHIDVNNAFLSWTAVDLLNKGSKYDIRNSYAVIGGDPKARRGIVLAKSTPCKKLGVITGETLFEAKKKCSTIKVYKPDYKLYSDMSHQLFTLLSKYSPDIEVASIDECYLDYGKVKGLYGDELEFAKKLKEEIKDKLKFTVNIGIANNKLCAKMASDFSKPDQIHTLYNDEIKSKMYPLSVGNLFGIGKKTNEKLINLNIKTIEDLANSDASFLYPYFKNQAIDMINKAKGLDYSEVISDEQIPDSISSEITLVNDISNKKQLYPYLLNIAEQLGLKVRKQQKYASVIAVIIKDSYFKRFTHQKKLTNATDSTDEIYNQAAEILNEMDIDKIRLIGIRLDKLTDKQVHQLSLFEDIEEKVKANKLDQTVDEIKNKYGSDIIKKASLKQDR